MGFDHCVSLMGSSAEEGLAPGSAILIEGGHYTIAPMRGGTLAEPSVEGEVLSTPAGVACEAKTTPSTRACFAAAVEATLQLRARGFGAELGLLVGDLALPPGARPMGGTWALPASYRAILASAALAPDCVRVYGEAYARNQGKRRLLDEELARLRPAVDTYGSQGWALFRGEREEICLASDASLDWEGDVRVAMLARGPAPLCPLVFAGLKRAIFRAGFRAHVAYYAVADDALIDRKLRAAAAAAAQLTGGRVGLQASRLFLASLEAPAVAISWTATELTTPGELPFPQFVEAVRAHHPGAEPLFAAA